MKKIIVAVMLVVLMCFGVTGCGGSFDAAGETEIEKEEVEAKDEATEEKVVEEKEETVKPEEEPEEEPEEVVEEVKYNEYQITQINTVFNNKRAWVNFNDGSDKKVGLIDTEGKVLIKFFNAIFS